MKRPFVVLASVLLSVALAAPAVAHEAGQWIIRGGVGTVMPKDDNLRIPELTIEVDGVEVTGSGAVQVDDGTSLVLSGTYMFTENWALDILGAWPFTHDVDIDVTASALGETVSLTLPFGEVEHLPPTVSVQYHFSPQAQFQPYAGLGVNYTTFLSEDISQVMVDEGILDFCLDDSFGLAAQLGADWILDEQWLINFDIRWINIESDLEVTVEGELGPETGDAGTIEIDPWYFAISLGYKF